MWEIFIAARCWAHHSKLISHFLENPYTLPEKIVKIGMIIIQERKKRMNRKLNWPVSVTTLYVLLILAIHPIIFQNHYFNILNVKYYFYCVCSIALFVLLGGYYLFSALSKKSERKYSIQALLKTLSPTDYAFLAFLLIAFISTMLSDFKYEAFWGNEGRFSGAFLLLLYTLSYFCVSRLLHFKSWFLDIALLSGMAVCLFGITDFFKMDLLHFKEGVKNPDMYTSFIGNINMYTGLLSIYMGTAAFLWVSCPNKLRSFWYYIHVWIIFVALITGQSDNAYLALAAAFVFIPFYAFRSRRGIRRYLILLATFLTSLKLVEWISTVYSDRVIHIYSIYNTLVGFSKLVPLLTSLWVLAAVLLLIDLITKKTDAKVTPWLSRIWGVLTALAFVSFIYVLYDVNIAGNVEKYGAAQKFLLFNDAWGTHRGAIWRIAITDYKGLSTIHKLFGHGPDTFGLMTYYRNHEEMSNVFHMIFENAHNEYLQYLITIGPLGLISYLAIFATAFVRIIRKGSSNPYILAPMFGVICYGVQAFVNIATPITVPILLLFLSMSLAGCRETL